MSEVESQVLELTKSQRYIDNGNMTDETKERVTAGFKGKLTKTEYWQANTKNKGEDVD